MAFLIALIERGGPVMWPLLLCSLLSVTIVLDRVRFWIRLRRARADDRIAGILEHARSNACAEAIALASGSSDAAVRVLVAGLNARASAPSEAMSTAASDEVSRMKAGLPVLDTIVTMAPLLGILGTVIGIIASFDLLGAAGIEDPKAVTGGIAQALISTAAGLTVALVTLVPFNYFVARTQREAERIARAATQLEIALGSSGAA